MRMPPQRETLRVRLPHSHVDVACQVSGNGRPILLIHNYAGNMTGLEDLTSELARSRTVIAYDQRDTGATRNGNEPYDRAMLADDAAELLSALDISRADVFGTSLGGTIAQLLAVRHPDVVAHLILNNTMDATLSSQEVSAEAMAVAERIRASATDSVRGLAELGLPPHFLDAHPDILVRFQRDDGRDATQRTRRSALLPGVLHHAADIRAKTLLVAGAADRTVPAWHSERLAATIPGATLVMLPGVGHLAPWQVPRELAELILEFTEA